jgi:hypothetical protein
MTRTALVCCLSLLTFGASAGAQDKAAAPPAGGAPDMTKMGPMSRPVTKEKEAKKAIEELFKSTEAAWKSGDMNAAADLIDFPVIMLSDDSAGVAQHMEVNREQWLALMKPMAEGMPKDGSIKMKSKRTVTLLSDTLGIVVSEDTMSGKMKGKWNSFNVVNYRDGKWKIKEMAEAGWGDIKAPSPSSATNTRK